jgi:hypothetical protein
LDDAWAGVEALALVDLAVLLLRAAPVAGVLARVAVVMLLSMAGLFERF